MNDLLTGAANLTQAVKINDALSYLLKMGRFELQKSSSNSKEFVTKIKKTLVIKIGLEM